MDFKSHEEIVLAPDEAAKKRALDAARTQRPSPQIREIQIPAGKAKIEKASASMKSSDGESAIPRVPVREIKLSAGESKVESATASLTPGDPVKSPEIQPKILNDGFRLLNQASRQGSPGGRLIRSGQLALDRDAIETTTPPRKSAVKKVKSTPKVKVEPIGEMKFSAENVSEVAALQAPPPVDPMPAIEVDTGIAEINTPESKVTQREIALRILANPGDAERIIDIIPPPDSDAGEQPEPENIDSKEFVKQLDLPEPVLIKTDSVKTAPVRTVKTAPVKTVKTAPVTVKTDSRKVPEPERRPDRETVIERELGQADARTMPTSSAADEPEKPAKKPKTKTRTKKASQKSCRDFIIAYDGVFIGHFRSRKRILNRTAFQKVARQMRSSTSSFDENKLQLYRPVPIEVNNLDTLDINDGAFMWFGDHQPGSRDPS